MDTLLASWAAPTSACSPGPARLSTPIRASGVQPRDGNLDPNADVVWIAVLALDDLGRDRLGYRSATHSVGACDQGRRSMSNGRLVFRRHGDIAHPSSWLPATLPDRQ